MNNVLLDYLPTEWNGYEVNTWYQVGIQIAQVQNDDDLAESERIQLIVELMFSNEDGTLRDFPIGNDFVECVKWFMTGWNHDKESKEKNRKILVDYDIDQWRIYADFLQIYGIDLNKSGMHWWMFNGLLWNMPYRNSSFMNVIEIRKKEIHSKMSKEEKASIQKAQEVYGLGTVDKEETYTSEEIEKIDEFDRMMEEIRRKKE